MRWLTLAAPPVALGLLLLSRTIPIRQKILGSIGIPLFGILYITFLGTASHVFLGIELYEWRGGYLPTLTFQPTRPDFAAVETHRNLINSLETPNPEPAGGVYWTDFRGPNRDGIYAEQAINTNWTAAPPKLLWRQPIGGGYASFAVAHGIAYTIEQRREKEVATAYDTQSGREVWAHGWNAEFTEPVGGDGPRATPTWNDGRIYAQGATGELRCLDAKTGALIWRRNILTENAGPDLDYGSAASPLVVDDLVITLPGGAGGHSIVAYDRKSGEKRWSSGDDRQEYVSPVLMNLAGARQLVVVAAKRTIGLRAEDGRQLWEFAWGEPLMGRNIAQPVGWGGNRLLLSAGYNVGCVAIEVDSDGGIFSVKKLWENKRLKNKFSSSAFWNGHIYGLDEDILTCINADDGERRWKDGRFGYGQILLCDGNLIILCGNGDLALVAARPDKLRLVARIPGIQGKTWNHPAAADGKLFVRNLVEMACFDLLPK